MRRNTRRLARRFQDIVRPHFALCREVPIQNSIDSPLSEGTGLRLSIIATDRKQANSFR